MTFRGRKMEASPFFSSLFFKVVCCLVTEETKMCLNTVKLHRMVLEEKCPIPGNARAVCRHFTGKNELTRKIIEQQRFFAITRRMISLWPHAGNSPFSRGGRSLQRPYQTMAGHTCGFSDASSVCFLVQQSGEFKQLFVWNF
ncbi:hypothetical protein AVEN_224364-1 [Araneus ventricosus]|uniref:Secreted protein n=1 Tax=Araneus ventricosus TaxID=182803 RepID=A0A4Y2QC72_ARAVE|nr:hypothetical protein AVEN_224364-1 [Araneus ventricosus]